MRKRFRSPTAKEGELLAKYGRHEGDLDIFYCYNGAGMKPDSRLLSNAFENTKIFEGKSLRQLLVERGYDITTLKFTINKLPVPFTGTQARKTGDNGL
jgi:hypothetical protein